MCGRQNNGDITYIPMQKESWCYLAVWQDKVTRRIIGWSLAETMTQDLVISALIKAIDKGFIKTGAIVHSDRGSQYASNGFWGTIENRRISAIDVGQRQLLRQRPSGNFHSRFKLELIENEAFEDIAEARTEIFSYIEG